MRPRAAGTTLARMSTNVSSTPAVTAIPEGTWSIDPAHSLIEFAVRHLGFATVKGRATEFEGAIRGGERPSGTLVMRADALTTHDPDRDRHLRTPDFLDAARHPELRFELRGARTGGDGLVLDGDLTIRGTTRPVQLTGRLTAVGVLDPYGDERLGLEAETVIDRRDFGVSWSEVLPGGNLVASNEVRLSASLSTVRED
jgi:polyisoprenoid-binding protein YceI